MKIIIFESLSESSLRKLKTLAPGVEVVQLYSKNMLEGIDVKKEFKRISGYASGVGREGLKLLCTILCTVRII
jgi:hypothetical protein